MDFYQLDTLGDSNNEQLALLCERPDGMGMKDYYLCHGKDATDYYPQQVSIPLRQGKRGSKICDLLGNNVNCLVVTAKLKQLLQQHSAGQRIDFHPFTALDQQQQPLPEQLYFANPIGTVDCLDVVASGVSYDEDGDVDDIDELIFSCKKLALAPALFRLKEEPTVYVIRQDLLLILRQHGIENLVVEAVKQDNWGADQN